MIDLDEFNENVLDFNCVLGLSLVIENASLKYNLTLSLGDSENDDANKLTVCFYDVSELYLSEFGGGLSQFMHLKISKNESGFDRKLYSLKDAVNGKISFSYASADIFE